MKNRKFWIAVVVAALTICCIFECRRKNNTPEPVPALETVDQGMKEDTTDWISDHSRIPNTDTLNVNIQMLVIEGMIAEAGRKDSLDETDYLAAKAAGNIAAANFIVGIYHRDVKRQNHLVDSLNGLLVIVGKPEIKH